MTNNTNKKTNKNGTSKCLYLAVSLTGLMLSACGSDDLRDDKRDAQRQAQQLSAQLEQLQQQDQQQLKRNKEKTANMIRDVFNSADSSAVDNYFHPSFIEHRPQNTAGIAGLKTDLDALAGNAVDEMQVERMLAENNLVFVHARQGSNITAMLLRFENDLIIERWQTFQAEISAANSASGRSMLDGGGNPELVLNAQQLQRNRNNASQFLERGLGQGDTEFMQTLFSSEYLQHNPFVPDGPDAVIGFVQGAGQIPVEVRYSVAQGDLVATYAHYPASAEGNAANQRGNAIFDLFRLDTNGQVAEHWDVVEATSTSERHINGWF